MHIYVHTFYYYYSMGALTIATTPFSPLTTLARCDCRGAGAHGHHIIHSKALRTRNAFTRAQVNNHIICTCRIQMSESLIVRDGSFVSKCQKMCAQSTKICAPMTPGHLHRTIRPKSTQTPNSRIPD